MPTIELVVDVFMDMDKPARKELDSLWEQGDQATSLQERELIRSRAVADLTNSVTSHVIEKFSKEADYCEIDYLADLESQTRRDLVARVVKRLRRAFGWGQEDLARFSEISQSAICKIEKGSYRLTNKVICKLAVAFRTEPHLIDPATPSPGKCLSIIREKAGLSRSELVKQYSLKFPLPKTEDALNDESIANYENSTVELDPVQVERLAQVLNVSVYQIDPMFDEKLINSSASR